MFLLATELWRSLKREITIYDIFVCPETENLLQRSLRLCLYMASGFVRALPNFILDLIADLIKIAENHFQLNIPDQQMLFMWLLPKEDFKDVATKIMKNMLVKSSKRNYFAFISSTHRTYVDQFCL